MVNKSVGCANNRHFLTTAGEAAMAFIKLPELDYLRQLLEYDCENGGFKWKYRPESHFKRKSDFTRWNRHIAGTFAGCLKDNGYVMIRIDNVLYCSHRLVWYYFNEIDPVNTVDHIDNNPSNNKIENLRLANQGQQNQNSRGWGKKKIKYKGVFPVTGYNTFFARIRVDGKNIYLGSYSNPEDAHKSYCEAAEKYYGEFANFGKKAVKNG